jgi:double-stranded uracil-DNA glycosylase
MRADSGDDRPTARGGAGGKAPSARDGLVPLIGADARLLILGSFPGDRSLALGQYYAHPRNAFWAIMASLLGTDPGAGYAQRCSRLQACGIGLWDVVARCHRAGSLDSAIRDAQPNPLPALLMQHPQITAVAFNGHAAAQLFSRRVAAALPAARSLALIQLPSTSPANARLSLLEKIHAWRSRLVAYLPPPATGHTPETRA